MKTPEDLEEFERAFRDDSSKCRRTCHCGKEFWDSGNGYDWDAGELESLQRSRTAISLDYAVETLTFKNRQYVLDCDCWHERARQVQRFLVGHDGKIARFLTLRKERALAEAKAMPEVKS